MSSFKTSIVALALATSSMVGMSVSAPVHAATAQNLDKDAQQALENLYKANKTA